MHGCQTSFQRAPSQSLIITRKEMLPFLLVNASLSLMTQLRDPGFFTGTALTTMEGPFPLLSRGGGGTNCKLVTPHLFLEPLAGAGADLKHHLGPARWG